MNRRRFFLFSSFCILVPLGYLGLGLRFLYFNCDTQTWTRYKDLIPLVIAIPLAILAAAWQRRTSYLQGMRDLWEQLVPAAHDAIVFARDVQPGSADYDQKFHDAEKQLSESIDLVRGVFKRPHGLYPYENLHSMHKLVMWLGRNSTAAPYSRPMIEGALSNLWKEMREEILKEFDRGVPYSWVSKYRHNGVDISDKVVKAIAQQADFDWKPPSTLK
jgi:hypothetical protein